MPSNTEWINKCDKSYTMTYYSAMRMNEPPTNSKEEVHKISVE